MALIRVNTQCHELYQTCAVPHAFSGGHGPPESVCSIMREVPEGAALWKNSVPYSAGARIGNNWKCDYATVAGKNNMKLSGGRPG